LYVEFKDGTSQEHWGDVGETDYKWAVRENILTEDYDLVEGLN